MSIRGARSIAVCALLLCLSACKKEENAEPAAQEKKPAAQATTPKPAETAAKPKPKPKPPEQKPRKVTAKPVATVSVAEGDPHKGQFSLDDATKGLAKGNTLIATLDTELGSLECELYDDKAPITVATFVGLARGLRAWKDKGQWVKKPLYDGTVFHRVVKGFMIQGGDPAGNGSGGPGFVIPDEIWEDAYHDQRGLLCMANRGPNTNGSQFFIMDGKAAHLDGGYTIFGKCSPEDVINKLASVPVKGDRSVEPVKIRKLTVKRILNKDKGKTPDTASSAASGVVPSPEAPKDTPAAKDTTPPKEVAPKKPVVGNTPAAPKSPALPVTPEAPKAEAPKPAPEAPKPTPEAPKPAPSTP